MPLYTLVKSGSSLVCVLYMADASLVNLQHMQPVKGLECSCPSENSRSSTTGPYCDIAQGVQVGLQLIEVSSQKD